MKPPDDNDGQQGREAPAILPRLSIILITGIAAVITAFVWPNAAPAAELAVTLVAMLLDALRQTGGRIDRE
ncbi:hypothetical protein [Mycobacterium paraterrae]|uniref:Uncharacterized protein n=1 Tax=Mycobacterium paraterrae TaxID=577492 RepID=A0ABY3VSH1_9MYCO|nr:hypothetical protein [Mycobacterium paraterrae]UMB70127.1 hypothetical protein MKK62_01930 [Mycobacterium paraterrae]